jgi:hypothetical protein
MEDPSLERTLGGLRGVFHKCVEAGAKLDPRAMLGSQLANGIVKSAKPFIENCSCPSRSVVRLRHGLHQGAEAGGSLVHVREGNGESSC